MAGRYQFAGCNLPCNMRCRMQQRMLCTFDELSVSLMQRRRNRMLTPEEFQGIWKSKHASNHCSAENQQQDLSHVAGGPVGP
jgi:hypothetical protein